MASVWTIRLHAAPLFQGQLSGNNVFDLRKDLFGISTTCCSRWVSTSKDVNNNRNLMLRGAFRVSTSTSDYPIQKDDVLPSSSSPPKIPANPIQDDDVFPSSSSAKTKKSMIVPLQKFQEIVISLPHRLIHMKRHSAASFSIGLIAAATLLIVFLKSYVAKRSKPSQPGSVADLVRRGQLRSDRRGISLKYEDPFNNPLVKADKSNSTVEMCGKVYRLAPVTLTKDQQAIHQKRRSRAYQWKRPELFLKEGDSIPADVDPDTVRWIPANHPFATTASDIDEDLAQENVYQKSGVPFRIRAEHEALQRKLEALQKGQKLGKLVLDPGAVKDFERPYKLPLKPEDQEQKDTNSQQCSKPPNTELSQGSFVNRASSEEIEKE